VTWRMVPRHGIGIEKWINGTWSHRGAEEGGSWLIDREKARLGWVKRIECGGADKAARVGLECFNHDGNRSRVGCLTQIDRCTI
jgi:hypothetical protein